jgi:hypothetical protein
MAPRLQRAEKKLAKYIKKLDDSPYYLAARVLDPECRTAFLKDQNDCMTIEGEKKLFGVRATKKTQKSPLESEENLSAFHKARLQHRLKHTRPQSLDEFDNYISENRIPLDSCTLLFNGGISLFSIRDFHDSHSLQLKFSRYLE